MAKKRSGKGSRGTPKSSGAGSQSTVPVSPAQAPIGIRQRFVESLLSGDRGTSFVKGCLLMKQAIESPFLDQQLELGRQAVALAPDLGELYGELCLHLSVQREAVSDYLKGTVGAQQVFGTHSPTVAEAVAALGNQGSVTPDWSNPRGPVSPLHFGHNTVWVRGGLGIWDEVNGAPDPEVLRLVRALKPGVLRFPGGTRAMRYHFDGAIGANRSPQCDTVTGQLDATHYGLDEFLGIAETVGADVTLVSPWVDGTPQEAAALVAYVNARTDSTAAIGIDDNDRDWKSAAYWARKRAENGHPDPYGVKFLEIGNEQYLAQGTPPAQSCGRPYRFFPNERWVKNQRIPTTALDHARQVSVTGKLVRSVCPSIRIGASAFSPLILPGESELGGDDAATAYAWLDSNSRDPWNVRLLQEAGSDFDFFILHPYDLEINLVFPTDPLSLAENLRTTVGQLRGLDRALRPDQARKDIAVTEFGCLFFAASFLGALLAAQMVRVSLEEQLLITLRHILIEDRISPFNLTEPFAMSGAILPGPSLMPGYWATRLLVESLSGAVVTARTDGVPGLVAFATYDEPGGAAAVVLIRHKLSGLTHDVDVALPPGTWRGTAHALSAPALSSPSNEITSDHPRVGPANGSISVVVPAQSLIVLKLQRA